MKKLLLTLISACILFNAHAQLEKELPARPQPARLVNDFAGILAPDQQAALERKLVAFDDSTSTQIAVVIVETTGDYPIADYAIALGRAWGVGNKEFNNGIVMLIAKNDRKIFIATGYGLEGALPDITAKHIIDNEIRSNFKQNDYYRGLDEGTDAIIASIKGEYAAPDNYRNKKDGGIPGILIVIIVVIIISILKRRGGGGTYGGGGYHRSPGGFMWFPGGGSSFGGGGGSSSGGFGGFGGGSFGGGGSGGSW